MPVHDLGLLSTFVVSLAAAFVGGLAVRAIHLPPLIGYLLAGIAVGPFTPGVTANQAIANELAEIGVALLLFNIGMHFSFKDLLSVRKIAIPGAILQVLLSTALGAWVSAQLLKTDGPASLMIGLSVAIASTAVATRILDERRQLNTVAGRVALGWLVVQDIVVILAMVLIPVLSAANDLSIAFLLPPLGKTFLQVMGFAVVMVIGGRRVIPPLLDYVARMGSRELFTLAVIVVALGVAYGSSLIFGVSLALGAFFAGIVIGESDLNHHAAAEALSLQQVFTILFFVSVGMLFDPRTILHMPLQIGAFLLTVVFGMGFSSFLILWLFRVPFQGAALVGAVFSQIGEFSFILSALGYQQGVFGATDRDLIMAVALLSIIVNPALLAVAVRLAAWMNETPLLAALRDRRTLKDMPPLDELDGHTILVGFGRVGSVIAKALQDNGLPYQAIDSDRTLTERYRRQGKKILFGDASREAVLMAAHPEKAKLLILAAPDPYQAKRVVRHMRKIRPDLDIIVRAHTDEEVKSIKKLGANVVIMGEHEIAYGMAGNALQKLGLTPDKSRETIDKLRQELDTKERPANA